MKLSRRLITAINEATTERHVSAINVALEKQDNGWSLLRYGVYPNQVGLQVFDREGAEAMVRAANSLAGRAADAFRGLPIYVGHPDDAAWAKANPTVRCEAVGRMPELQATDAGLRLRTAWNTKGKELVEGDAPVFDSYSPNWGMLPITYQGRKAFRPVELFSIGLTNKPNIPGTFIGLNEALPADLPLVPEKQKQATTMKDLLIALLALLGITVPKETADDAFAPFIDQAKTKLADMKPSSAVNEIQALLDTAKQQLTAANGQVTTAVNEAAALRTALATERAGRAGVVITTAINEGRLTEAQKPDWLAKFTAPGADFAAVQAELGKLTKAVNTKTKVPDLGARRGAKTGNQTTVTAVNEAINAIQKETGCTRPEAMAAARLKKPDLFNTEEAAV
ncbi:MAG TPA: hypothetical protein VK985_09545 [Rariglobus sp.]|nr:hypothetical protein [Rariglobus sp.]